MACGEPSASDPAGAGFLAAVDEALASTAAGAPPGFVLLSAGFDGLRGDPLGDVGLTPRDYFEATVRVRKFAEQFCGGRLVSVLEGGYGDALGEAAVQHVRALAGLQPAA